MMKKKVKTGAQPPSSKKLKIQLKNLSAITRKTCLKKGGVAKINLMPRPPNFVEL
jgi:hypothetical protein